MQGDATMTALHMNNTAILRLYYACSYRQPHIRVRLITYFPDRYVYAILAILSSKDFKQDTPYSGNDLD